MEKGGGSEGWKNLPHFHVDLCASILFEQWFGNRLNNVGLIDFLSYRSKEIEFFCTCNIVILNSRNFFKINLKLLILGTLFVCPFYPFLVHFGQVCLFSAEILIFYPTNKSKCVKPQLLPWGAPEFTNKYLLKAIYNLKDFFLWLILPFVDSE